MEKDIEGMMRRHGWRIWAMLAYLLFPVVWPLGHKVRWWVLDHTEMSCQIRLVEWYIKRGCERWAFADICQGGDPIAWRGGD
jgi:hypothetical protein